jgi:hypothetical protein
MVVFHIYVAYRSAKRKTSVDGESRAFSFEFKKTT